MLKTLLAFTGALVLAAPGLHAQDGRHNFAPRPQAYSHGGGYRYGGGGRGHYGGRYFYFGGVPYLFPYYGYGFGYPYYYDNYPPYGAYEGPWYYGEDPNGPYNGPPAPETAQAHGSRSLPTIVQRRLAEEGYYKGSIDGQFGPASKAAITRYQRDHHLKETGMIDEPTLSSLGFRDRP